MSNIRKYSKQTYQRKYGGEYFSNEENLNATIPLIPSENTSFMPSKETNNLVDECIPLIGKVITGKDIENLFNKNDNLNNMMENIHLNNFNNDYMKPVYTKLLDPKVNKIEDQAICLYPFSETCNPILDTFLRCKTCAAFPHFKSNLSDLNDLWSCALCGNSNEVPNELHHTFSKELEMIKNNSTIDYILSNKKDDEHKDLPNLIFIIDVSYNSVKNGTLSSTIFSIKNTLDNLDGQFNVCFITFDKNIHFYQFKKNREANMLVINDVNPFLPLPFDKLMVEFNKFKLEIINFLMSLEAMFQFNINVDNCCGDVLNMLAENKEVNIGSIFLFLNTMPNYGQGVLTVKGGTSILGTKQEYTLLIESNSFYKQLAIKFSDNSIAVNLFVACNSEVDLQSLAVLSKYSGGRMFYYTDFNYHIDHLIYDLNSILNSKSVFASNLQVMMPEGIQSMGFLGNLFMTSNTSCFTGNLNPTSSVIFEFKVIDELFIIMDYQSNINYACFQAVWTYLDSYGNLICKVINITMPITTSIEKHLTSVNCTNLLQFWNAKALDEITTKPLDDTRLQFKNLLENYLLDYYKSIITSNTLLDQFILPVKITMLPYLTSCCLKMLPYTIGSNTLPNDRTKIIMKLNSISNNDFVDFICPPLFHLIINDNNFEFKRLNLSSLYINSYNIIMLKTQDIILFWIGKQVDIDILNGLFEVDNIDGLLNIEGWHSIPKLQNMIKSKFQIDNLLPFKLIFENSMDKEKFFNFLHEDRNNNGPSYHQFLLELLNSLKKKLGVNG